MVDNALLKTVTPDNSVQIRSTLRSYHESWSNLDWAGSNGYRMWDGPVWELYGGVLAQGVMQPMTDLVRTMHFAQLPSKARGIPGKVWSIDKLALSVRDFGMDPSQDLLAAIHKR
jgi:hypothetical protein